MTVEPATASPLMLVGAVVPRWEEVRAVLAERDLEQFVLEAWAIIEPETPFTGGWHIGAICEHLQAVTARQIRDLLVLVPPRHTKSITVSVCWPAWSWIHRPGDRFLFASYAAGLSVEHAVLSRRVIESDWYQTFWHDRFQLTTDQNVKSHYENSERGYRITASLGATVTGRGGDYLVLDDPHNLDEIHSERARVQVVEFYRSVWHNRVNDPKTGCRVCIMQRGHEDDLAGHMAEDFGYEVLRLPMEYDPARARVTTIGFRDPRTEPGELLCPERFGVEEVEAAKRVMGPDYQTQYNQDPQPYEGVLFQRDWFKTVKVLPNEGMGRGVRFWDCAATEMAPGKDPDWTVGTLVVRHETSGIFYVTDLVRLRATPGEVDATILKTAQLDGQAVRIREEQEPGSSGKSVIAAHTRMLAGYLYKGVPATGAKTLRWRAFAAQCQAGNVKLLEGEWNRAWLQEMCSVPMARHDDQADSVAGAFNEIALGRKHARVVKTM